MGRGFRILYLLIPLAAVLALAWILRAILSEPERRAPDGPPELVVWSASPFELPVLETAEMFQRRTGIRVRTRFGPSAQLYREFLRSGEADMLLTDEADRLDLDRLPGTLQLDAAWDVRLAPGAALAIFPRDREAVQAAMLSRTDTARPDELAEWRRFIAGRAGEERFYKYRLVLEPAGNIETDEVER